MNIYLNSKALRKYNIIKYKGVAPSWDAIELAVKKSKFKTYVIFEAVWGIPRGTLTLCKCNHREMPARYWHIFYDFDIVYKLFIQKNDKKNISNKNTVLNTNKQLVDGLRY